MKQMKKRIISLAVVLSMLLSGVGTETVARAEEKVWGQGGTPFNWTKGTGAEDIKVAVSGGAMTVTGTGAMGNYTATNAKKDYYTEKENITKITVSSGITKVGNYNFMDFDQCTNIELAETVTEIGTQAFSGCTNESLVIDIKGVLQNVATNSFGSSKFAVKGTVKVYDQKSYEKLYKEGLTYKLELVNGTDALKTELSNLVSTTRSGYHEEDYTEESWSKLTQALTEAETLASQEDATADKLTAAKNAIETAVRNLVTKVSELKQQIQEKITATGKIDKGGYTKSSVAALQDAIEKAQQEAQKDEATKEDLESALTALEKAMEVDATGLADTGLKKKADSEHLGSLDTALNNKIKPEFYTEESYQEYQNAISKLEAMQADYENYTNEEIEAALQNLKEAEGKLVRNEEYSVDHQKYEKALEAVLKILDAEESPYTKKSLELLQSYYDIAVSAIGTKDNYKDQSQETIDKQTDRLNDAINPESDSCILVEKADLAKINALIAEAKKLQQSKYTEATWKTFSDALAEAEKLTADPENAAKADAEAAEKALDVAIKALVEKPATQTPPGTGNVTNPGTGNKPGTVTDNKPVTVKKVNLKKVSSPKKKTLKITWKKLSGVTGYEIQIGTNKKVTKNKKLIRIKKAKTVSKTVKKLKSKKKYYVKIRAYKTVNGEKYYGAWSKPKKVKIK